MNYNTATTTAYTFEDPSEIKQAGIIINMFFYDVWRACALYSPNVISIDHQLKKYLNSSYPYPKDVKVVIASW